MIYSEKGRVNIKEKKRIHEDWRLKDVKTVLGIRLGLSSKDKIFVRATHRKQIYKYKRWEKRFCFRKKPAVRYTYNLVMVIF